MRKLSAHTFEMLTALLSRAGVAPLATGTAAPAAGAEAAYTVQNAQTRRCIIIHAGGATPALGDIRFAYNATATATDFPLIHAQYFRVDAEKTDSLSFWNTTAGSITVFILEVK